MSAVAMDTGLFARARSTVRAVDARKPCVSFIDESLIMLFCTSDDAYLHSYLYSE